MRPWLFIVTVWTLQLTVPLRTECGCMVASVFYLPAVWDACTASTAGPHSFLPSAFRTHCQSEGTWLRVRGRAGAEAQAVHGTLWAAHFRIKPNTSTMRLRDKKGAKNTIRLGRQNILRRRWWEGMIIRIRNETVVASLKTLFQKSIGDTEYNHENLSGTAKTAEISNQESPTLNPWLHCCVIVLGEQELGCNEE
jgi:hypothetical protein